MPAIHHAVLGRHDQAAIGVTVDQTRKGHIPMFFQGVLHPPQGKGNLPGIRNTLKPDGIVGIVIPNQGKIVRRNGERVRADDRPAGLRFGRKLFQSFVKLFRSSYAIPDLPPPVLPVPFVYIRPRPAAAFADALLNDLISFF